MTRLKPLPVLLLAFVAFYLLPLGLHGLWIPDETRYAQISQEMLQSGNWVAPHFMGIRYFEKPAGGYWLIALGQAVFGQNLFGVRIASALTTGLSVLLAYLIARRLWNDPRKSFACALLYLSFGLVAGQAGYSNLDPQFTLWVNLSLVALWFALDSTTLRGRLGAWVIVGLACAMGFMTKGFLALVLPVLIAVPYMLWQRRLGELLRYGPLAMAVAVLVGLPWVLAIHLQEPDFWRFFFWNEHIRRFSADNAQHVRPWWFFLPIIAVSSLPWAGLLPSALHKTWQEKRQPAITFLALWLLLPLGLFSLSKGKLPTYIMPCLLPLALLMGHTLTDLVKQGKARTICLNGLFNFVIGMAAMIGLIYLQIARPLYSNSHAEMFSLSLAFIVLLVWILANLLQVIRPLTLWAMPAMGIGVLVILLPASMPSWIADNEMPDQFVLEHLDELQQTQALLSNDLGSASALAWRLKRPQVSLYDTEGELRYGLQYAGSVHRKVELEEVQAWLKDARQHGSVGVLLRVNSTSEMREAGQLPPGGKRYYKGYLELIIYPSLP
ncbi:MULTISPECIES: lipid IV(A) 4-amino-4-deoxy-L-arabinosyltransferase [Pseudomonas]|jgi:4-amino-4-deoxy-L-arabinose transferase|uniref:Undecaprenyl phosphate-alpha-4-amino-4-deoxy-L-arabinose arabinosyl transferase n=1 Tax=Pseudomonas extremorientalis TaxID=169669 RepID=A0A1H0M1I8_9PSED|nr:MULTISPECIES: lipid IV(A) 4-amino-4-deoxy-L-arabinosyltransferase [Pseudomonas]KAB0520737.1 lipid IV(A) 4-amino-4-deoxy-L-arabinosyltransferase [Pseudomonas extremorientalis]OIN04637.1 4-amino-4-deoxy-L-arabinose lipid A transferase [Pseudomonas extremorientalis]QZP19414.1 lipid IV(A) 4-amino-4-deoxy-L-arabinosyltransferase [Pseudomonas sp. DR208]WLG54721.1 lipid IV(A) 4-amino-4-deoxy-L-arabinosyltransferase [Pseudomonas extremorientalis]SDO74319.1 4-amino-4-deoxy-L-arabinose transferase [P